MAPLMKATPIQIQMASPTVDVEEYDGLDNDGDGWVDEIFGDSDFDGTATVWMSKSAMDR